MGDPTSPENIEELPVLYGEDEKETHFDLTDEDEVRGQEEYLRVEDNNDLQDVDIEPVEIDIEKEVSA